MRIYHLIVAPVLVLTALLWLSTCTSKHNQKDVSPSQASNNQLYIPTVSASDLETDSIGRSFAIAMGDIASNIRFFSRGPVADSSTSLYAGLDYYGPWSRDGATSISNGVAIIAPGASRGILTSQLIMDKSGKLVFGGEYWDNVLLVKAHYDYYLATGDTTLLHKGWLAACNTLAAREQDEFNQDYGLFRGAAGFNDGISGYPDFYANTGKYEGADWVSNIKKWPKHRANDPYKAKVGFGLPLMPLSTNCIYYEAYQTMPMIEIELGRQPSDHWTSKAEKLKQAINKHLWREELGRYIYYVDPNGDCLHQEGEGISYAISTGIADEAKQGMLKSNVIMAKAGLPCLWPGFSRYDRFKPSSKTAYRHYPRHAQTVWAMVQTFWAHAAAKTGDSSALHHEVALQQKHAMRDMMFMELYHPDTEMPYGGVQEDNNGQLVLWESARRQTWAATGYYRNIIHDVLGITLTENGIELKPILSDRFAKTRVRGLHIRNADYDFYFSGRGRKIRQILLNGQPVKGIIPFASHGHHIVQVQMAN